MGAAASLFYSSNDSQKQTLHRRIIPSDEQFEEQQDRWNALAEHVIKDLKGTERLFRPDVASGLVQIWDTSSPCPSW